MQTFVFLPERYRSLRLYLAELRGRRANRIPAADLRVIQNAVTKLSDGETVAITYLANPSQGMPPNLIPLQSAIQALSSMLTGLSVQLNRSAMGEIDDER
jgi:hypothetical protein